MKQKQIWQRVQEEDFAPLLDKIAFLGSAAALVAAIILFVEDLLFFAVLDAFFFVFLGLMVALGPKVKVQHKMSVLFVAISIHATLSLWEHGLLGTGLLFFMLMQILTLVYLDKNRALILSSLPFAVILTFGLLIHLGYFAYEAHLIQNMNSLTIWLITGIALFVFLVASMSSITRLKERLLNNIQELQESNNTLQLSNYKLGESRKELEQLAFYDELTGLPKRSKFEPLVQERLGSYQQNGFLILINIKGFRIINSIFGREAGNEILRFWGRLIDKYSNENTIIARLESDEFVVWAENWDEEELDSKIKKFHDDFHQNMPGDIFAARISFYVAAVAFPEDFSTLEEGLRKAGIALRVAKQSGSPGVMRFYPSMSQNLEADHRLRHLLEKALEKGDFEVHYQNKVNIYSEKVVGVEALARWHSQDLGQVGPDTFIPVLSSSQLIIPFTQFIMEKIIRDLPSLHQSHGGQTKVSINVSPLFFLKPGLIDYLTRIIERGGADPTDITLEITEDFFLEDIRTIGRVIRKLKEAGISISLDDFGKGFSSLFYISNLELDELKVDKSFINNICNDKKSFELFSSICNIGQTLGYKVIAEGVERKEQVETIKKTPCEIVQGFYYSRPAPIAPVANLIS